MPQHVRHITGFIIVLGLVVLLNYLNSQVFSRVRPPRTPKPIIYPTSHQTFQERRNRVRQVCNERKGEYLETFGCNGPYWHRNLYVSENLSMVYCLIHKVGSSYWKNLGLRYNALPLSNYSATKREEFLKKFTTVLVVRHPFTRLVSAYNDRMTSMIPAFVEQYGPKMSQFLPLKKRNPCLFYMTFEAFSRFVISEAVKFSNFDSHWMPFFQRCRACDIDYDVIGTLETFKEDMAYLDRLVHIESRAESKKRFYRKTVDACKPFKSGRSTYNHTEDTCKDVQKILEAKTKGLLNKGYFLPNESITFNSTNKNLWFDICMHLTSKILVRPDGLAQISQQKKDRTRQAFRSLKESTYNKLKALYKMDFEMFGYDPDDIFK